MWSHLVLVEKVVLAAEVAAEVLLYLATELVQVEELQIQYLHQLDGVIMVENNGNGCYCAGGGGGAGANGYDGEMCYHSTSLIPRGQLGRGGTGLIVHITVGDVGYAGGGSAALSERGPDIGGGGRGPGGYPTPDLVLLVKLMWFWWWRRLSNSCQ